MLSSWLNLSRTHATVTLVHAMVGWPLQFNMIRPFFICVTSLWPVLSGGLLYLSAPLMRARLHILRHASGLAYSLPERCGGARPGALRAHFPEYPAVPRRWPRPARPA